MAVDQSIQVAIEHAESAGLRYVYDSDAGLTRKRRGRGFAFYDSSGTIIKDEKKIERCKALAIPPAWQRVWICTYGDGHIQATGFDARQRKQYIYHPEWRAARDRTKFENMLAFGHALPAVRRQVLTALNLDGLPREKVIAAIVRLLDRTGLRVGNDAYTAENDTFGLSTIRKKHLELRGTEISLDFPGKGSKVWRGSLTDAKAAKVIAECADVPGYRLFKYIDDGGGAVAVGSADINGWLHEITQSNITAKDFRTWSACTLFLEEAMKQTKCEEGKKPELKPILKAVADQLGNTPAILQKSYVHPELVDLYRTGCFMEKEWQESNAQIPAGLRKAEALLLAWLEKRYK